MEKRYQVFVSSTYEDLQEERKEVMQALLELDCIPAGMELFPASNDDQWTLIKKVIDDCDYYLLIIGGRYGSTNNDGISYTQMEFEYALETGKPIISFLPKDPGSIPSGKCEKLEENHQKLEAFKTKAKQKLVKFWSTPQDLGSIVSRSVIKLIKDYPAIGWVKAANLTDDTTIKELLALKKENEELKKQLSTITIQAPKGIENLSQDNEEVTLSIDICETITGDSIRVRQTINVSWNDIFKYVSPFLLTKCSERDFRRHLNQFIDIRKNAILKEHGFLVDQYDCFYLTIKLESYNLIKIQLKALGLIKLSENENFKDSWTLTTYGDHVMTQMLAMKKSTENPI